MKLANSKQSGFWLVDVLVGMTIIILILGAFVVTSLKSSQAITAMFSQSKVDHKLKSVEDQISKEAIDSYETLPPSSDWTGTTDPNIHVMAYVGAPDAVALSRPITLKATWMAGSKQQEKDLTFALSKMRGQVTGAILKIRVVQQGTGVRLPGVTISAQGQSVPQLSGVTDSNGVCLLIGVLISPQGCQFKVDGQVLRAFFTNGGADGTQPSFYKFFQTAATAYNTMNTDYFDGGSQGPVQINLPSTIVGRVKDSVTGGAVAGMRVELAPKAGSQLITFDLSGSDQIQFTDANGNYQFSKVVPGTYWVYALGNAATDPMPRYAGLATPDDYYKPPTSPAPVGWTYPGGSFNVGLNEIKNAPDLATIKKGDVTGTLQGVRWNGGGWELGSLVTNFNNFTIINENFALSAPGIYTNTGTEVFRSFLNSTAYLDFWSSASGTSIVPTDAAGNFQLLQFEPNMVDGTMDEPGQYQKLAGCVMPGGAGAPSPFTPIFMTAPPNPQMLLPYPYAFGQYVTFPSTISFLSTPTNYLSWYLNSASYQYIKIYPNQNNSQNFYMLEESGLGNVVGNVKWADGPPFSFSGTVTGLTGQGGRGGIHIESYGNWLDDFYMVGTTPGSGSHTFDMTQNVNASGLPNGGPPLPPNLNAQDFTVLTFRANGDSHTSALPFQGSIICTEKILDTVSGNIIYRTVPANQMNISGLSLTGTGFDQSSQTYPQLWTDSIDINNPTFQTGVEPASYYDTYTSTIVVQVQPGPPAHQDFLVSRNPQPSYTNYVTVSHPDWSIYLYFPWYAGYSWYTPSLNDTAFATYCTTACTAAGSSGVSVGGWPSIPLVRVGTTGKIFGHVIDGGNGQPILGATVTLHRTGYPTSTYSDLTLTTVADACTTYGISGCDANTYQFAFDGVTFLEWNQKNLTITVQKAGLNIGTDSSDAYTGFEWHRDFTLVAPSTSVSGGDL